MGEDTLTFISDCGVKQKGKRPDNFTGNMGEGMKVPGVMKARNGVLSLRSKILFITSHRKERQILMIGTSTR